MALIFTNNAYSTLASGITAGATSITLATGEGARFPSPSGGDTFLLTLTNSGGTETSWEVVECTARSGDTLTVTRGKEGVNQSWVLGSKAELRITAGMLNDVVRRPVLMTAQNSTSGTSIDFSSIPSWVKRITVMFNGVSVSGANPAKVQLGTSSGVDATGYVGASSSIGASAAATSNYTDGFNVRGLTGGDAFNGSIVLHNVSGNLWVASGVLANSTTTGTAITSGNKTLSGTLDRVRITINGADTFDAGTITVLYE